MGNATMLTVSVNMDAIQEYYGDRCLQRNVSTYKIGKVQMVSNVYKSV